MEVLGMSLYIGNYFGYGGYNFLSTQVPLYLLMFAVIFIVLAKLLNSAVAAIPVAVLVTAATGSYFLLFVRSTFLGMNDVAVIGGIVLIYAVFARMLLKI